MGTYFSGWAHLTLYYLTAFLQILRLGATSVSLIITLIELYQSCDNKGIQLMVSMNAYTELIPSKCGLRLYMLHYTLSSAMNYYAACARGLIFQGGPI